MPSSQPDSRGHRLRRFFPPELPFVIVLLLGVGLSVWSLMAIRDQTMTSVAAQTRTSIDSSSETADSEATESATATDTSWIEGVQSSATQRVDPTPATGEKFGTLKIPALGKSLPIIEGTGTKELSKGVGHFAQSVMPGKPDNCVLSGHRDTVFTGLGELNQGDVFVVTTTAGEFTYRITKTRIVDDEDRTVIVPTDHAVLTVTTCYPFDYVGSAPKRYILTADLVETR